MRLFVRRLTAASCLAGLLLAGPGLEFHQALAHELLGRIPRAARPTVVAPSLSLPPAAPLAGLSAISSLGPAQAARPMARLHPLDAAPPPAQAVLAQAAGAASALTDNGLSTTQTRAEAGKFFETNHAPAGSDLAAAAAPAGNAPLPPAQTESARPGDPRDPAPPAPPSKSPGTRAWLGRTLVMAGAILALDWSLKTLVVAVGVPYTFHAVGPVRQVLTQIVIGSTVASAAYSLNLAHGREPLTKRLAAIRAKHPALGTALTVIFYILNFDLFKFKSRLPQNGYAGDILEKYPQLKRVLGVMDGAWAAMIAGVLGNGLGVILQGGAVDFIPFGHARLNIADIGIFMGIPLMELARQFLDAARTADETGKPLAMKFSRIYRWPVLGLLAFYFSTWFGYTDLPEVAWYVLLFSTIFAVTISISHLIFERLAVAFNKNFIKSSP